ncbi:MAG TPA: MBL fold metallo-hydrolase [Actinocrinis sp.]|jgi:glyoxylase-like metal-dependent hydrolase (beta-lactamase superfamily II)|uniref:MBL fold metallo-hydrolase n=1 Tax=Actinocrinis sp. TaxID=1920516 RepID=UPI002DDDA13E|nr:MBL fold metallo-hydrolase [Actinocrinis sp.]HEV3171985.1 MBL fold metallo-hydrolase [Actinocrinis sp.]
MEHEWHEVGERVFRKRFDPCDVTVTAVVGTDGVAVVDTRCSVAEAREVAEQIRRFTSAPVRWVVNTHAHFDHAWGNAEFLAPRQDPPARIWGHASLPARFDLDDPFVADILRQMRAAGPEWAAQVAGLELVPPTELVHESATIDLGGRLLELRHHGRGHTDADLWIRIPDAGVVLAGDLVEESGPPAFGLDSFPMQWAATLDRALDWMGPDAIIVPGHGEPVGREFVSTQRGMIDAVAREIARLHAAGVKAADAPAEGTWPLTTKELRDAIARGYAELT